jgi:DNA-formamidopyrimidine glycosylase
MPEGPEVRLVTDHLRKKIVGKYIHSIDILSGRYVHHGPPKNFNKFIQLLPLKVESINSYGKFIWWEFANTELTLWNTLGMSGWWQIKDEKHNNIAIKYYQSGKTKNLKTIFFNDPRNFGTIIFETKKKLNEKIGKFGPDILDQNIENQNKFVNLIKKKKTKICEVLLDQKVAAGCGNYLRAEALYLTEINPFILAKDIPEEKIKELWNILGQLAWYYYDKNQGIKLKIINTKYRFADYFDRVFLIYNQKIDPLGNKVKKEQVKNRTIHWVPSIQT